MLGEPLRVLGLVSTVSLWKALLLTALAFAAGVVGGFVGLAFGSVRLPALLLLGVPAPVAAGTNILISALSGLTGSLRHLREGRVDWRLSLTLGLPSVAGAFLGGFLGGRVSEALLIGLVGAFVGWQGLALWRRAREAEGGDDPPGPQRPPPPGARLGAEVGIGLGIGLLGGAVGLMLGTLRLPAMVRFLGVEPRRAVGTSMVIGVALGFFGFLGHGLRGEVDLPLLVLLGLAGMAGTYYGARQTGRVRLQTLLRVMGAVLAGVGLLLLVQALLEAL